MNVPGIVLHEQSIKRLDDFLAAPIHALLLAGSAGIGKTHIARSASAALLGIDEPKLADYAYYRLVSPKNNSIGIEQVRDLTSFFRLTVPGKMAVKRIAVIEDADNMGIEAQTALLKLLEEPPADSVLLLTSSQPKLLLPTIRSRTQIVQLTDPEAAALMSHFTALGHEEKMVSAAMLRSGSNAAAIMRLLDNAEDNKDAALELVKRALAGTAYDRLLLIDSLSKQKETAGRFVDALATVAMASLEAGAKRGANTLTRWHGILQSAQTAQEAFQRNGSTKLVLTELMLTL